MNKTDVLSAMPAADFRNPWMGLNGRECKQPAYWCRLHRVWLSEADAELKHCFSRLTYNMLATYRCKCIETRGVNPWTKQEVQR